MPQAGSGALGGAAVKDLHLDWPSVLDALEARVRAQEAAIEGRGPYPDGDDIAFTVDGPLPEELRMRAIALVYRCNSLQAKAGAELARRRKRLTGPPA